MVEEILQDQGKLIFVVLCFALVSELAMAMFFFMRVKDLLSNSNKVKAKIVEMAAYERNGHATKFQQPVVEFKDQMRQQVRTKVHIAYANGMRNVGEEIEIVYNKDYPEKVYPYLPLQRYGYRLRWQGERQC